MIEGLLLLLGILEIGLLLLVVVVKTDHFGVETDPVFSCLAGCGADSGDECPCVDNLQVRGHAGHFALLGGLKGLLVLLDHKHFEEYVVHQGQQPLVPVRLETHVVGDRLGVRHGTFEFFALNQVQGL